MADAAIARQIRLERRLPSYWRVTLDHPPLNIFGPETIPQLNEIITGKVLWLGERHPIEKKVGPVFDASGE